MAAWRRGFADLLRLGGPGLEPVVPANLFKYIACPPLFMLWDVADLVAAWEADERRTERAA